jgi:hypothetical protein
MVHALREAHRVLKPSGLLIDLRPGAVRRRIGVACTGAFQELGAFRRKSDDLRAANRAIAQVVRAGLFLAGKLIKFDCPRYIDTLDEFQAWQAEFVRSPHDVGMLERIERALTANCDGGRKIAGVVPLTMRVLRKLERLRNLR